MRLHLKRRLQASVSLVCILVLVFSMLTVYADDIDDLESTTSDLQNQLSSINQELVSISDEISTNEMQIEITNSEIQRTADNLTIAEEHEAQQYEDMKNRIKYMYETGNASMLEMLFSAENMTDFLNKADFIQNVSDYDRDMLTQLQTTRDEIASQQQILQAQQDSLAQLQSDLEVRKEELAAKAESTSTDLAAFQAQLEQLRAEEAARLAAEAAAQQAAAVAAAQQASGGNTGGSSDYSGGYSSGGSTNVSSDELTLLAAIIECEAYQNYDYLLAVATVILNRVNSPSFGGSISEVVYASGQFEPVWTGRLDACLNRGPTSLSLQVAQDALNGSRLAAVADCYYFLYAGATNHAGVNVGNNVFFAVW